jgi:hypothetical protein
MICRPRRWHSREARFIGLLGLCLLLGGLYLGEALEQAAHPGRGHRQIDLKVLEGRIRTGELRDREADWYHPENTEEASRNP